MEHPQGGRGGVWGMGLWGSVRDAQRLVCGVKQPQPRARNRSGPIGVHRATWNPLIPPPDACAAASKGKATGAGSPLLPQTREIQASECRATHRKRKLFCLPV